MRSVKQQLHSDCAAACLMYITSHHGLAISSALVRRLAGTTETGTTALGLIQAAEKLGLTAKGVRGNIEALQSCPAPMIAHVKLPSGRSHYLVVVKQKKGRIRVMDPAVGETTWYSLESFSAIWTGILILLAPGDKFERGSRTAQPITRLIRMLLSHKDTIVQMLLGSIILGVLGITMSFYVQRIVDNVIPDSNRSLLNLLGIAMIVLFLARILLSWFQFLFASKLAQRIDSTLILSYYRHVLRLPQSFFDTMRIGEITSRISDAVQIRSFLSSVLVSLVLNPVILVSCFGAMFFYSSKLALLSLSQLPLQLLTLFWVNRLNRKYQRAIKERGAEMTSHVTEVFHTISTIKRFAMEATVAVKTETHFVRLLRTTWNAGIEGFYCSAVSGLGSSLYSLGMLWYGSTLVLKATITPGQLMSSYALAMYVSGSLANLIGISANFQQTLIATDRLFEIMDEVPEPSGGSIVLTPALVGTITLENVTMKHAGRLPVLSEITLRIPAGQTTIIAGESGCGKSSLFAMLQRLYLPESGHITIGKVDFDYISTTSLRTMLSVLPQRIELISGSILSNIAVADAFPDIVKVTELCDELGILEFINSLPKKFDTLLSEGGLALSGGQRQRIALARTFYRQAPIILLDEPTTALGRESIRRLVAIILRLKSSGTTIVIATHTKVLFQTADSVIVLKNGRVISHSFKQEISSLKQINPSEKPPAISANSIFGHQALAPDVPTS